VELWLVQIALKNLTNVGSRRIRPPSLLARVRAGFVVCPLYVGLHMSDRLSACMEL
jgi:hypothetical protein